MRRGRSIGTGIDAPRASHLAPPTSWSVSVPSFRVDVLREIDLIEEIARHDGYLGLPATFPELTVRPSRRPTRGRCAIGCCGRS